MSESGIEQLLAGLGQHAQMATITNPGTGKPSHLLPIFTHAEVLEADQETARPVESAATHT